MATFCVFTPTFNRAKLLPELYKSLESQTFKDFRWLVVDDGSTDNTEQVIDTLGETSPFQIEYIKTVNGGKQRATNLAVSICDDELFYGVDSDDLLVPDALEKVAILWNEIKVDSSLAGIVALHGRNSHEPIGSWMPKEIMRANVWDLYYKFGFQGDAPQIYRTEVLKDYPYPVAEGEKFISECISTYQIAKKYEMGILNEIVSIARYQEGGYTDGSIGLIKDNPKGYCKVKMLSIEMSSTFFQRLYHTILYLVGCELAGKSDGIKSAPYKGLAILGLIPSKILLATKFK